MRRELDQALIVVRDRPVLAVGQRGDGEHGLRDIDADEAVHHHPPRETIDVARPCGMRGGGPRQLFGLSAIQNEGPQANERARGPKAERDTTLVRNYNQAHIQRFKAVFQT